jgi:BirA family biotin operon repressor/biotin-[acetyl-CoA-carboxylase] ligase
VIGRLDLALVRCGSTNDEIARLAGLGAPHGTVLSAVEQTAGRGRLGRRWASPPGNLYLSVLLRPALAPADVPPITLAAGVAVAEAAQAFGVAPELKWPNDVLVGGRKLAGILTEMSSRAGRVEHVAVGIGVDLGAELPAELDSVATSLRRETGVAVDTAAFRAALIGELDRWLGAYLDGGVAAITPAWLRHARLADRRIRAAADGPADGWIEGRAAGLDAHGRLDLIDDRGRHYYVAAGEVAWVDAPPPARSA